MIDLTIDEKKERVTNRKFLERSWGVVKNSLIQQGVTRHNLAVLEHTYVHWFTELENIPMYVALEDILNPLFEVERESLVSDLDENLTPTEKNDHTERLTASLQMIKTFFSSFGVVTAQFFEQDTTSGTPPGVKSGKSVK